MTAENAKRRAALRACEAVEPGMVLGLGTGSTAFHVVAEIGRRVSGGLDVAAVPTSEATRRQAAALGIRLLSLDEAPVLDLAIDGADEIDPSLALVKGGGGALLREKLVAAASRRVLIVADGSKQVDRLGRFPLPVEIVPFGQETTRRRIERLLRDLGLPSATALRVRDGAPVRTDGGNFLLDCPLGAIPDPAALGAALKATLGVVEHGLFVGLADAALIGTATGVMEVARP